jgi:hypothetical protein
MPGRSYGLSAKLCRRGSKLRDVPGSVCSTCYARRGWYETWHPLHVGQQRRLNGLDHPQWIDAMVFLISRYCKAPQHYFRWHDSGDLQSIQHLANIVEISRRTPTVKHWLPTHEVGMVSRYLQAGGTIPTNLVVRISADRHDQPAKLGATLALLPTSTVHTTSAPVEIEDQRTVTCHAIDRRGRCGGCRKCWDPEVKNVSYPHH